ncbi:hypothetical protein PR202_gb17089 [Eleusine coracana subsp. coracana]|uniref:RING-type E3 ubiquitin transferase n=1 Tax=Eleusine coracana subsp. coracana TaxID=191504 RepID=A0AAV5F361_ELECO|nr:hypothetical protein PR202_gb17089 [Eleusine coracana subsp. coracana]
MSYISSQVCTFYQKGACSYGSRCRYDHVKVSRNPRVLPPPPSSSTARPVASTLQVLSSSHHPHIGHQKDSSNETLQTSMNMLAHSASKPAWSSDFQQATVSEDGIDWPSSPTVQNQTPMRLLLLMLPIVLLLLLVVLMGKVARRCKLCTTCGKMCLHPYRPDEREEHIKLCEKNHKRLETLKRSQEIECSVCLDRVLSKPTAAERKFGLLSECDHPFCIACIRNWRNNSPASGMDVNSALRACPVCRKLSYFVIPSVLWFFSKEEKQDIVESYKSKLKSIDCKYFDFGTGSCPFGTSCFYRHAYRDGRLEEVVLRHLDADDGSTVIAKNIRLSDFLGRLHL